MNNYACLLLWPLAGLLALGVLLHQLRKYGTSLAELIAYLNVQKDKPAFTPKGITYLCVLIVILGPIGLIPIALDAIKRLRNES